MGDFIAFADVALAVAKPAVGVVMQGAGLPSAFLVGAAATCAAPCLLPAIRPGRAA